MAKKLCTFVGAVLVVVGLAGFAMPGLLGLHLSLAHNLVHIISGAIAIYLGLKGTESAARSFCWIFGIVYLLLGVAGFLAGDAANDRMLALIPGTLELGTVDHAVHVLIGALFVVGGLASRRAP
jgi:uncharacterized protein DUF4383